jgi:hypothetical protein
MGIAYNPRIVTDGLRVSYDTGNVKCYPGSGNTLFSLNGTEDASTTTIATATDATAGTILNHNSSTAITVNLSPNVNHEVWSMMLWVRSTGTTPSNYRNIVRLEQTGGPGYFYIIDTRQTTNTYVLGVQKDYYVNSWYTYDFNNQTQWTAQGWWCIGVSHNNTVFKSYVNGDLKNTQTQTRSVVDYTNLTQIRINPSSGNTVYMGPLFFYDKILTDDEFKQNFNATRGRFGI